MERTKLNNNIYGTTVHKGKKTFCIVCARDILEKEDMVFMDRNTRMVNVCEDCCSEIYNLWKGLVP